jgi:membrane dipeptidase
MTRRLLLALAFAALPIVASAAEKKSPPPPPITVDTHVDTPTEYMNKPFDLGVANTRGHFDFARMKSGGVDAVFLVAYVPRKLADKGAAAFCLKIMETVRTMVDSQPDKAAFVTSTAGMRKAQKEGKRAVLIGIEGGHAIEDSLDILRSFYRLGARYMTLTHTNTNHWADSSGDKPAHDGLTDFGRDVVREMNRLGMMVDVSHVADATFWDVIETTRAPIIASHSSARALAEHNRNMTDDMLRAVAKNGGVVMVNFYPVFISSEVGAAATARNARHKAEMDALDAKYPDEGAEYDAAVNAMRAADPLPKAPLSVVADHIEHIAKVAGVDHVGIGSDFDGIDEVPAGLEDISRMPNLRAELKRRGFSEGDLRKIMGENLMRVFAAVEKVAASSH